jgi:hypothetical protein
MKPMRRQRNTQDRNNHKRKRQNPTQNSRFTIETTCKHRKTSRATLRKTENTLSTTISKQPSARCEVKKETKQAHHLPASLRHQYFYYSLNAKPSVLGWLNGSGGSLQSCSI